MRGRVLAVATVAALALLTGTAMAEDTIIADGVGSVQIKPDIMILRSGVEVRKPSVGEAYDAAGQAAGKVIAALKAQGVAEKDIKTADLSVQPEYVRDAYPKIEAYRGSEGITAVIRKLDAASATLKAVASAGDEVRIEGITFDKDDWSKETEQARAKAYKDAVNKAHQIALLANRRLGRLINAQSSMVDPIPPHLYPMPKEAVLANAAPPIQPGEATVRVNVVLTFALA